MFKHFGESQLLIPGSIPGAPGTVAGSALQPPGPSWEGSGTAGASSAERGLLPPPREAACGRGNSLRLVLGHFPEKSAAWPAGRGPLGKKGAGDRAGRHRPRTTSGAGVAGPVALVRWRGSPQTPACSTALRPRSGSHGSREGPADESRHTRGHHPRPWSLPAPRSVSTAAVTVTKGHAPGDPDTARPRAETEGTRGQDVPGPGWGPASPEDAATKTSPGSNLGGLGGEPGPGWGHHTHRPPSGPGQGPSGASKTRERSPSGSHQDYLLPE